MAVSYLDVSSFGYQTALDLGATKTRSGITVLKTHPNHDTLVGRWGRLEFNSTNVRHDKLLNNIEKNQTTPCVQYHYQRTLPDPALVDTYIDMFFKPINPKPARPNPKNI